MKTKLEELKTLGDVMIPKFSRRELEVLYQGIRAGRIRVIPGCPTTLTAKDLMEELLLVLDGPPSPL